MAASAEKRFQFGLNVMRAVKSGTANQPFTQGNQPNHCGYQRKLGVKTPEFEIKLDSKFI